jgi:L-ascorbate metabolism protein UlaG (beta-lactamase superfamily)
MSSKAAQLIYIGGPTALIEFAGAKFLTDPTFDPAGGDYITGPVTLRKQIAPAVEASAIGRIDVVLLSHDHHFDNLDHAGRALLGKSKIVLTTVEGAQRLGGNSIGLKPWETYDLTTETGKTVRIVATPARHGPADHDRGPVIGFVLYEPQEGPLGGVYFSGDTVWYEGVSEVAAKYPVRTVLLNLGAANVPIVGPFHLTMTAEEGVLAAAAFPQATIVPLHFEGWEHFSEGRQATSRIFAEAGIAERVRWLEPGKSERV